MTDAILVAGWPPLTMGAADSALDAIDFIAAAVRGVDLIDVTDTVRAIWRRHLAQWYPQLPPATREWYAKAETINLSLRTQWPLLDPMQRAMLLQQWSMELPQMLWLLEPVLAEARVVDVQRREILDRLAQMRQELLQAVKANTRPSEADEEATPPQPSETQAPARPAATPQRTSSAAAINELGRQADINIMLQNHATRMNTLTMGLMSAMNRR
jgi:hypothetical protein